MFSGFGSTPAEAVKRECLTTIAIIGILVPIFFLMMARWATVGAIVMWGLCIGLIVAVSLAGMLRELRTFVVVLGITSLIATWILSTSKKHASNSGS